MLRPCLLLFAAFCLGRFGVLGSYESDKSHSQFAPQDFSAQTAEGSGAVHRREQGFSLHSNLWYHNQRIYSVLEGGSDGSFSQQTRLGKNIELADLQVAKASDFYNNFDAQWLAGVAILVDFPFPAHPNNLGLWLEILVPIFCVLEEATWTASLPHRPVESIVFLNTYRDDVVDVGWLWSMWAVGLSPTTQTGKQPSLIFADDIGAVKKEAWLGFEHILIAHNRYTDPKKVSGFTSHKIAEKFRETSYRLARLDLPKHPGNSLTYMSSVAGEMVVNQDELMDHLEEVAESCGLLNRPYTATGEAPFSSFVSVMRRTGVLIARHGGLLANAVFLPPGSVILELLPYNWDWDGASSFYKNLTSSMGDIHHFAWRAYSTDTAYYLSEEDELYQNWTSSECTSPGCITAHATAGMLADCSAIKKLLMEVVPKALSGVPVAKLQQPWPKV